MNQAIFISLASLTTLFSAPAYAEMSVEKYEVLGVHFGDDPESVSSAMKNAGFSLRTGKIFSSNCKNSYENIKAEYVKARTIPGLNIIDLRCSEEYFKENHDTVNVSYLYKPGGRSVSGLSYHFKSTEEFSELSSRISKKFGRPCDDQSGIDVWSLQNFCYKANPGVSLNDLWGRGYDLSMDYFEMEKIFEEELRKDVRRSLGDSKASL